MKENYDSSVSSYSELINMLDKNNMKNKCNERLQEGFVVADCFLTQRYLDCFSNGSIQETSSDKLCQQDLRIFRITKIVYDPKEEVNDKFISVYSSLHNLSSNVGLYIVSDAKDIKFYMITKCKENARNAGETLRSTLKGNFPGIEISESFDVDKKKELLDSFGKSAKSLSTVSLIPSERDENKEKFIQGMEKFLDSMNGKKFEVLLLATPIDSETLSNRKRGYEELYSTLSPHAKLTMSYANSKSDSVNDSISSSISNSVNNSISNSNSSSTSTSSGVGSGSNSNSGVSFSSDGAGFNMGSGSSSNSFSSYTSGTSFSQTVTNGTGRTDTDGLTKGTTTTQSDTDTTTLEFENKSVKALMERAEQNLKRISLCESYGMWDFCAYFFSEDASVTSQAASVYKSLMMGQESIAENSHMNSWGLNKLKTVQQILETIKYLNHPVATIRAFDQYKEQQVTPTNMLSGKEIPIVLGFPRKSVSGLAVIEMAEFGRAVVYENIKRVKRFIDFGNIYHMGIKEELRVPMNVDLLASHCFITGSAGSGKSYATYNLLDNLIQIGIKMLIIEPAKGEYKQVFGGIKDVKIYTTDPNVYKMLRINPFQFPDGLHVLTHIEKLIQIFNASWSLTAAMPAILKDAVVRSYVACGWDIMNSIWIEGISDHKYPVFKDVLNVLPEIINESDYSSDTKGDYKGALLTRVQSMTSGISGLIFEKSEGVNDNNLFNSNTIVDLSDIGSEETVALLMGVLIMRLGEYHTSMRKLGKDDGRDSELKHVTVLEEAHNILKRTSKEQSQEGSNIVGKSVEMISNSIKEMRTYGEGFIIIDQSPMAVDSSAIENTSTKIIMNTPAKDACEELSSALSLNDNQAKELSRLTTGVAAAFQKGWLTPVLMKIDEWKNKYETEVEKADLKAFCILKGNLITEIYEQKHENQYLLNKLRAIIRNAPISKDKKNEFGEYVDILANLLKANSNKLDEAGIGKVVLNILDCQGLFNVIYSDEIISIDLYEQIATENPSWRNIERDRMFLNKCQQWVSRFKKALPQYAIINDEQVIDEMINDILLYKCYSEGGTSSYLSMILHFLE